MFALRAGEWSVCAARSARPGAGPFDGVHDALDRRGERVRVVAAYRDVPELAARPLRLAVEVEVRALDREQALARRNRAHEVDHHRAAAERAAPERLSRDGPDVGLELAGLGALDRKVTGVVDARRDLVREEVAVSLEELEREDADMIELHEQRRDRIARARREPLTHVRSGRVGAEEDPAAVHVLDERVGRGGAVEADDAYAALLLAVMHYYGTGEEGWEPDHARAFELFSKADRAGDPVARAELGMMHLRGDGVPADRAKAIRLLLSAGRDGVPLALVRAGGLLREASPEKDLGAAASAFLMAAEMNFPSGMYFFAEMLRQGQGIKADRVEAMKWYLLAAEHPDADEAIKSLAARSVTLHKAQLSFWDFRRARTLAKTWLEQPDPDR